MVRLPLIHLILSLALEIRAVLMTLEWEACYGRVERRRRLEKEGAAEDMVENNDGWMM